MPHSDMLLPRLQDMLAGFRKEDTEKQEIYSRDGTFQNIWLNWEDATLRHNFSSLLEITA